ncbi:MAG: glycosyltransferase family 4 protein [Clostridium lundense]|nr:glycosyltransferase family 4 protein [Clostridium lundense]
MGKRVLFLANHFITLHAFREELILRLLQEGHEVWLSLPDSPDNQHYLDLGCKVIPTPIDRRGVNPIKDLKLLLAYRRIVGEVRPDIVFSYTVKPNIYGTMVTNGKYRQICNITGVGTALINPGFIRTICIILYRISVKNCYKSFFQNTDDRDLLLHLGLVGDNYAVLPGSGVNLDRYRAQPYPKESRSLIFTTVGRIMKNKGVDELLAAARTIKGRYPEVRFRMIGFFDGEYESIIKKAEQEGIIEYLGQQEDMRPFYAESHAIIHPSYREGMSNVLLEAAATARPVLASNITGCRETFDEGVSGLGFEPKNVDDLVSAIERFIALPYEQKAAMGRAGREKMEPEFSREIVVAAYLKEIENMTEMTKQDGR